MSLFEELKRRNVFRVGIAYAVAAWLLLQLTEVLTELLQLPPAVGHTVIVVLAVGLIPALIFSWVYELTPDGIRKDADVRRDDLVASHTGKKLNLVTIGMLVAVAGLVLFDRLVPGPAAEGAPAAATTALSTGEVGVSNDQPAAPAGAPAARPADTEPESASIAVLPFANRSNVTEDLFFTDGIHDDLLTQLAKIGELKVISRTSVMEYRGSTKKIPEIAGELGVGRILEGGVQRAGDRVRINVQLIDVATDQHLWAETFDRKLTIDNIFDIQSEITTQIVTAVKGELSDTDRERLSDRPTDNLAAWEALLYARAIISEPDYNAEKYRRAEPFAREAVTLDPEFAQAWAELAMIQLQGVWIGYANTPEQRGSVRESLARAEALAPQDPWVKKARADYHYRANLDYESALATVEEAIALAPGNADLYTDQATTLRRLGRWDEAVAAFERCLELDPLNGFAATTLIETLAMMNAWERVSQLAEAWLIRKPASSDLLVHKADAMLRLRGDVQGAYDLLQSTPAGRIGRAGVLLANLAAMRGDWDLALSLDKEGGYLEIFDFTDDFRLAGRFMQKGDQETARGYLEAYFEHARQNAPADRRAAGFRNMNLAEAYLWLDEPAQARRHAELAVEAMPAELDHVFGVGIERRFIRLMAALGERDFALDRIAAKLDRPEGFSRWQLYLDQGWDFFRDDPRFNELARPDGIEPEPFRRLEDKT